MRVYDFINLSNVKHLLEIGFNDSWDSGEFKDRIDIINILLKIFFRGMLLDCLTR